MVEGAAEGEAEEAAEVGEVEGSWCQDGSQQGEGVKEEGAKVESEKGKVGVEVQGEGEAVVVVVEEVVGVVVVEVEVGVGWRNQWQNW